MNNEDVKILLVDDDEGYLFTVKQILQKQGLNIESISNPEEAIKYLKNNRIDILLSDYFMPQMNGEEFINKIREFDKELIIILQTGYADQKPPLEMLKNLNIQGYFDKTEEIDDLIILIISAIKTIELNRQLQEKEKELDAEKFKNEFFGKFLYRVIGETGERFSVISGLIDTLTNSEERKKYSDEELKKYSNNIKTALHEFMEYIQSLEIEGRDEFSVKEFLNKIKILFKTKLMFNNVNLNCYFETEDAKSFVIYGGIKAPIYILVDIIEYLLKTNEKNINIHILKTSDDIVEFKIENKIENDELVSELKKISKLEEGISIIIEEGIISLIINNC